MRLDGRVAAITGGGSGMGRATALRFAAEGAHVVVIDVDAQAAAAVTAEIAAAGTGSAEAAVVDVTDNAALRALFEELGTRHEALHVLFNNAGYPGPAGPDAPEDEYALTMDINLRAGYYATSYALPLLRKAAPHASVLFTASTSGLVGSPMGILYSAAKGGVVLLMKSLALSLGPEGIRVNAICPGPTDTPMLPRFFGRDAGDGLKEKIDTFVKTTIPLQRLAQPEDMADAALYLASDESAYVHGVALPVDGGYTAR
jgi:NAD(P)-dependent dehydrogenase (short-subunit alcohol dehydrogenase family)